MAQPREQDEQQQKLVDKFFHTRMRYWKEIYEGAEFDGIIYQQRQAVALNFIDGLSLPRTVHVLEIGCGAGFMSIALAQRGFFVEAIDHVQAMIEVTQRHAREVGLENQINSRTGDIHELTYEDESFDLIVALGVIPWLHNFRKALFEIARVLTTNGYVVLSMDNALRATKLLDPITFPLIARIRMLTRSQLVRARLLSPQNPGSNAPPYRQHSSKEFNKNLSDAGLAVMKFRSVGFGPFTFFGHRLFSDEIGIKIQYKLQRYADNGFPILRSSGSQYVVLATKKHFKSIS